MSTAEARPPGLGGDFWGVWTAGIVSYLGDGLSAGALPLLAVSLTSDARLIGLVDALAMSGWVLLGLVSGVVIDRVDRFSLMWRVDGVRAVLAVAFAVLVLAGAVRIGWVLGVAFVLGLAAPFFDNASSAVLPDIVPSGQLERANSFLQAPMLVATSLVGPPVGAIVFGLAHGAPFVVDAVSFALSAVILVVLVRHRRRRPTAAPGEPVPTGALRMVREGLTYLFSNTVLRSLAVMLALVNLATGGVIAVLVLYVTRALDLPGSAYGWIIATFAVGGLLGTVVTPWLAPRLGTRVCVLGSVFVFAAAMVVLGVWPLLAVAVPMLVVTGVASTLWNVVTISYRQRVVPPALLGRVTSTYRMIGIGGAPIGAVLAGLVTQAYGVRPTYVAAGVLLAVGGLLWWRPLWRLPGRPAPGTA